MSDMIISNGKKKSNFISKSSFDEKISRSNSILPYHFEKKDIEMSDLRIKLPDKKDTLDDFMSLDEAI